MHREHSPRQVHPGEHMVPVFGETWESPSGAMEWVTPMMSVQMLSKPNQPDSECLCQFLASADDRHHPKEIGDERKVDEAGRASSQR